MADDPREEDTWLYGNPESSKDDESSAVDGNDANAQESSVAQTIESAEAPDKEKVQVTLFDKVHTKCKHVFRIKIQN